ncbi:hypothetical protein [Shimia sp. SDUM112013]|uniref:hypothetical protein n=1 Tax=Shimia sp. SDUM112013 TaxID=3136160 RepID=UPI0032EBF04B
MTDKIQTFPGGRDALMQRYNVRREPFVFDHDSLPPADIDLAPLTQRFVTEDATRKQPGEPRRASSFSRKRRAMAEEFIGKSELAFLNGLLISNLRKTSAPDAAAPLFLRLWEEQPDHLISQLDLRWQVSSIMTFADHGGTDVQRQVGQAMRMLFGLMKLYEFERQYSGFDPTVPFGFAKRSKAALPMEMDSYSLLHGGLDVNILAPVWNLAMTDPGIAPLANHLFEMLNHDPATLFRRLNRMKEVYARLKGKA